MLFLSVALAATLSTHDLEWLSRFDSEMGGNETGWPLTLTTVHFLGALAVAAASATALGLPRLRPLLAAMLAPLIFIAVYLLTREVGFFPRETQSGWVFLFEPALGLVAAAPLAFVLTLVACWVWRAR